MAGETGPVSLPFGLPRLSLPYSGMACLNCAELLVIDFYTFKRYRGLYFWSIIVADLGTVAYAREPAAALCSRS